MYNLKSNSRKTNGYGEGSPCTGGRLCEDCLEAEMPAEETKPTPPAGRMLALLVSVSVWAAKAPTEIPLGMHTKGLTKPEKSRHSQSGMSTVTHP